VIGKSKARQPRICASVGRSNRMLKHIRTFFGRTKNKTNIVEQGSAWYCTECNLVFLTKQAGDKHSCEYRFQDTIVRMRKDAETET
jgi:hypothetical protein